LGLDVHFFVENNLQFNIFFMDSIDVTNEPPPLIHIGNVNTVCEVFRGKKYENMLSR
jgi:hypothetical protein